jgi:catalase
MVNAEGKWNYVQIHYKSDQGIENWTAEEAKNLGKLIASSYRLSLSVVEYSRHSLLSLPSSLPP